MKDRISYIFVYACAPGETLPTLAGIWRGSYPGCGDDESIGPLVRQGLAGFNDRATWRDLAEQLENSGFCREGASVDEVMRVAGDVARIVFLASGQINCQWFTHGPDDNARAADQPIAILPSRGDN